MVATSFQRSIKHMQQSERAYFFSKVATNHVIFCHRSKTFSCLWQKYWGHCKSLFGPKWHNIASVLVKGQQSSGNKKYAKQNGIKKWAVRNIYTEGKRCTTTCNVVAREQCLLVKLLLSVLWWLHSVAVPLFSNSSEYSTTIGTHSHTEGKREQLHLNFFTALHKPGFKLYLQCSALSSFERRERM